MGKSTKTQRLREKMRDAVKQSKQTTFDNLPELPKKKKFVEASVHRQKKQIVITEIGSVTKEDELVLKIEFKLVPSRTVFSRIKSELFFDGQKLSSVTISIPQSPLAKDEFELTPVLDMKGIVAGEHVIKVEMYELWGSGEKLTCASNELTIEYVPLKREDRLIKIPIVKSVAGADLTVVSDSEKDIYREIDESMRNEEASKRDEW
jgi:hypothetical protein